ncbi:hypothetical protein REH65_11020 [Saccharopolyspora sp. ID03-671]|uniref:hypothetical protein n=1 Tax=Saccharopolyspora sp. ID03-671 TaxID=3073066 RepID=UPI00324B1635
MTTPVARSEWIRGVLVAAAAGEGESSMSKVGRRRAADLLRRLQRLIDPDARQRHAADEDVCG